MYRRLVTSAIARPRRRTSSKVSRLKGAMAPARWHETQRAPRIGAMSEV
jgi:hypothetical protein